MNATAKVPPEMMEVYVLVNVVMIMALAGVNQAILEAIAINVIMDTMKQILQMKKRPLIIKKLGQPLNWLRNRTTIVMQ